MPLHLDFAPDAQHLLQPLSQGLQRYWLDPLQPPTLMVPNPDVGQWLTLRLTEQNTCITGLSMQTLERSIWNWLQPDPNMRRLGVIELQQILITLLGAETLQDIRYQPVQSYLQDPHTGKVDPLRRVQLAAYLARLFQEYEFNRPSVWDDTLQDWRVPGLDMVWLHSEQSFYFSRSDQNIDESVKIQEAWQQDLYRRSESIRKQGWTHPDTEEPLIHYLSLPHLYRHRKENGDPQGQPWKLSPQHLFLFQVSKISHWHRNLLVEISQMPGVHVHVHLTNPCAEFWEDVDTRRLRIPRQKWSSQDPKDHMGVCPRQPEDYQKECLDHQDFGQDPPLLQWWGQAGKENIYLWCPQAEWHFNYHAPHWIDSDRPPQTLLQDLQRSLLRRESRLSQSWHQDHSLQILAAPDPDREVEELREQILDALQQGIIEKLEEVVIYLPDPSPYLAAIHQVLGAYGSQDPGYIPYRVLGIPGGDSLFTQGWLELLQMVEGTFDRARVFAFLRNPILQATQHVTEEDVSIWEQWAIQTGIFRGFHRQHKQEMGDEGDVVNDLHTFEWGLARLLVGNLAAGPTDLGFQWNAGPLWVKPYRDWNTSDNVLLERFFSLIQELFTDTRAIRQGVQQGWTLAQASQSLERLLQKWMGELPQEKSWNPAAEGRVRQTFLQGLQSCQQVGNLTRSNSDPMELKELTAMIRSLLPAEIEMGQKAWVGGVTIAPLRSAMILPHTLVFALGLGADVFPGTQIKNPSDLLHHRRFIGDHDVVRSNRFAFLELVHAARKRLILSFQARNMQKEEDLQPSSVLLELEDYLHSQNIPSQRRSLAWIRWENSHEERTWNCEDIQIKEIAQQPRAQHRFPCVSPLSLHEKNRTILSQQEFVLFLNNPLEYHLRRNLGLDLVETHGLIHENQEPVHGDFRALLKIKKQLWLHLLKRAFSGESENTLCAETWSLWQNFAEEQASNLYEQYRCEGLGPNVPFDTLEHASLVQWAHQRLQSLHLLQEKYPQHQLYHGTDFALGREGYPAFLQQKDFQIESQNFWVLIPPPISEEPLIFIQFAHQKKKIRAREKLELWSMMVLQSLYERQRGRTPAIHGLLLYWGEEETLKQWDTTQIRSEVHWSDLEKWMQKLLPQILQGQAYFLPWDPIRITLGKKIKKRPQTSLQDLWTNDIAEELSEAVENTQQKYLDAWQITEKRLPDPDNMSQLICERFAPLLEGWAHE